MSISVYCDNDHEGKWFCSLSRQLAYAPIIRIKQRGHNPIYVEGLLRYDKPDIILINGEHPRLVVEKTSEVPSGHNIGQRFGRIVNAAEEGVLALFFIPFLARKHGRYSSACYIPGRFFNALEKIRIIHNVPVLALEWPSNSSYELITDSSENKEIGELIDDLICNNFDYSKCHKINSIQNLMLERSQTCNKHTHHTPNSVKIRNTVDYVNELRKQFPKYSNTISTTILNRPLSLVYEIRMAETSCKRTDPYTGTQFVYDYMVCRKGQNPSDKIQNLILSFPYISRRVWLKSNPNKQSQKSALWYATANLIVLRDGLIPCESKVDQKSYENQLLKALDENRLYQKVKKYLEDYKWIILGGQPAGGTDHLPIIEIKDYTNPHKGSKGSRKIDLIAFKNPFFLMSELKDSYVDKDICKLNEIADLPRLRLAFFNALREKEILKSHHIEIKPQDYVDSGKYLIKSVGYNISSRSAPEDFVTFVLKGEIVKPSFGKQISEEVIRLFNHS